MFRRPEPALNHKLPVAENLLDREFTPAEPDRIWASVDALRMAWFRRRPEVGVIFHSDRGSQY